MDANETAVDAGAVVALDDEDRRLPNRFRPGMRGF
jgi:hypothetical protein